jgi:hypothetical protein
MSLLIISQLNRPLAYTTEHVECALTAALDRAPVSRQYSGVLVQGRRFVRQGGRQ